MHTLKILFLDLGPHETHFYSQNFSCVFSWWRPLFPHFISVLLTDSWSCGQMVKNKHCSRADILLTFCRTSGFPSSSNSYPAHGFELKPFLSSNSLNSHTKKNSVSFSPNTSAPSFPSHLSLLEPWCTIHPLDLRLPCQPQWASWALLLMKTTKKKNNSARSGQAKLMRSKRSNLAIMQTWKEVN